MSMLEEIGSGLSGLEQIRLLMESGRRFGIAESLDFRCVEVGEGFAIFEGTPGDHAYNPMGAVHGGYAASILDSGCGFAVQSKLAAGVGCTTLELKVCYHKAITRNTGLVRGRADVVTIGRRVAFTEAKLTDSNGRLLASATSTLMIISK